MLCWANRILSRLVNFPITSIQIKRFGSCPPVDKKKLCAREGGVIWHLFVIGHNTGGGCCLSAHYYYNTVIVLCTQIWAPPPSSTMSTHYYYNTVIVLCTQIWAPPPSSTMSTRRTASDESLFRISPYHYIHVLDQNTNVTRLEIGPQTFVRQDNERSVLTPWSPKPG